MSAVENKSPVIAVNIISTGFCQNTNRKLYKVDLVHADKTVTPGKEIAPKNDTLRIALCHTDANPDADLVIYDEVESPTCPPDMLKKALPPTIVSQLNKNQVWANLMRGLIDAAWNDGVILELEYANKQIDNGKLPTDWTSTSTHVSIDPGTSSYMEKPYLVKVHSIAKRTAVKTEGNPNEFSFQYLGQYFPTHNEKKLVPHPLDHGNMDPELWKVAAMDIYNPNGKVLHIEPRNPTTPLYKEGELEKLQDACRETPGFQKAFDATVADTGGYITKAVEELFPSETIAVDNSPTATKVK